MPADIFFTHTVEISLYSIFVHWPKLPLLYQWVSAYFQESRERQIDVDRPDKDSVALATEVKVGRLEEKLTNWKNDRWREHFLVASWASLAFWLQSNYLEIKSRNIGWIVLWSISLLFVRESFLPSLQKPLASSPLSDFILSTIAFLFSLLRLASDNARGEFILTEINDPVATCVLLHVVHHLRWGTTQFSTIESVWLLQHPRNLANICSLHANESPHGN